MNPLTHPLLPRVGEKVRLTRFVLPVFFALSIGLWLWAPIAVMSQLTPIVGALAVLCAGLNLARVSLQVYRFSARHRERLSGAGNVRLKRLRRSLYGMAGVLVVTAVMAAGFYFLSTMTLDNAATPDDARLLWGLAVGGMVLAIVFGELVTHLIDVVDEAMRIMTAEH